MKPRSLERIESAVYAAIVAAALIFVALHF
jgi:hypothetical protein